VGGLIVLVLGLLFFRPCFIFKPQFSGKIVYSKDKDIWIMNADGGGKKKLTNFVPRLEMALEKEGTSLRNEGYWAPAISPDGTMIAFQEIWIGDRGGPPDAVIHVIDFEGKTLYQTIENPVRIRSAPIWAPQGNILAYIESRDLVILNLETKKPQKITLDENSVFHRPFWTVDGKYVTLPFRERFLSQDTSNLYKINIETGEKEKLLNAIIGDYLPATPIYSISTNGQVAFVTPTGVSLFKIDSPDIPGIKIATTYEPPEKEKAKMKVYQEVYWSPDGEKLAFWANLWEKRLVEIVNQNGETIKRITIPSGDFVEWSPDSKALLVYSRYGEMEIIPLTCRGKIDLKEKGDSPTWWTPK